MQNCSYLSGGLVVLKRLKRNYRHGKPHPECRVSETSRPVTVKGLGFRGLGV